MDLWQILLILWPAKKYPETEHKNTEQPQKVRIPTLAWNTVVLSVEQLTHCMQIPILLPSHDRRNYLG